jgi:hypothetical protein
MVRKEWAMVEGVHVGNDKFFLFKCKHHKIQQTPSHTSRELWPPIIIINKFHGLVKYKMAYS